MLRVRVIPIASGARLPARPATAVLSTTVTRRSQAPPRSRSRPVEPNTRYGGVVTHVAGVLDVGCLEKRLMPAKCGSTPRRKSGWSYRSGPPRADPCREPNAAPYATPAWQPPLRFRRFPALRGKPVEVRVVAVQARRGQRNPGLARFEKWFDRLVPNGMHPGRYSRDGAWPLANGGSPGRTPRCATPSWRRIGSGISGGD
jgi:hypothetical protein